MKTQSILIRALLVFFACAFITSASAQRLNPSKPEDAIKIDRKVNCSTEDGKAAVYWWHGRVHSRVPGERDRHIFNVQGFNLRTCKGYNDPQRGPGYRSVSREMLIYFDAQTNQVCALGKIPGRMKRSKSCTWPTTRSACANRLMHTAKTPSPARVRWASSTKASCCRAAARRGCFTKIRSRAITRRTSAAGITRWRP
jgi:hypothetical protein